MCERWCVCPCVPSVEALIGTMFHLTLVLTTNSVACTVYSDLCRHIICFAFDWNSINNVNHCWCSLIRNNILRAHQIDLYWCSFWPKLNFGPIEIGFCTCERRFRLHSHCESKSTHAWTIQLHFFSTTWARTFFHSFFFVIVVVLCVCFVFSFRSKRPK